ncbi:uncharacterized protein [Nicotiana tomentosiformis]|uniref:uncharacterized protein n=1 Tax=Nicotiana tomentosiformis TaxID=4098 RepID=UPI00388C827C
MAPKKRARTGQGANVALGVAVDPLFDDAGEHPRGEDNPLNNTLPDSTTPAQATPVPTPTEGATIPPPGFPIPPLASASGSGISDGDLRGAIQILTQIVASQDQRSNVAPTSSSQQGDSTSSRVNRFLQLDPPVFTSANPEEDPQDFIDAMHKTLRVMRTTEMEGVELAAYCLKGVAYSWFELWEDSREEGSPPARWSEFADAFIDHFIPTETRAARAAEFENLRQGSRDMNYGKMVAFAQATEDRKLKNRREREGTSKAWSAGNFGDSFGGGRSAFRGGSSGPTQSHAQYSASALPVGHKPEQLPKPLSVSTLVDKSIVATRVYRGCVVTVRGQDTVADLIELGMVDFDIIMGMDWLHSCFAKLDYRTRTMRFEFPSEPLVEWKGDNVVPKSRFISYLKATKMINNGCIYYFVRVMDTDAEAPTLESVPVVKEFLEVFPDELPRIPPDREIDFGLM